jgi:hypothetical protein
MSNCYCHPGRAGGPPLDVSVGNGEVFAGQIGAHFNNLLRFRIINPFIDIMYSIQSELADKATAQLIGDPSMKERMLRINTPLHKLIDLDDVYEAVGVLNPFAEKRADETVDQFTKLIHSRVTSSPPFCSAHSCWLPPVDGAESG